MSAIAPALPAVPHRPATAAAPAPLATTDDLVSGRIAIEDVSPCLANGRLPAKAVPDEDFTVSATVFREGHGVLGARVVLHNPQGEPERWFPMREAVPGTDRWSATVAASAPGNLTFTIEAWSDPLADWLHEADVKIPAGLDTERVLAEGARLLDSVARGVPDSTGRE